MLFVEKTVKFLWRTIILLTVVIVILVNGQNSFAQGGITSPLPQDANAQYKSNYYPDERLPENLTSILLLTGIFLMLVGTEISSGAMVQFIRQKHKGKSVIISKHFGHSI
jgi:hypothetical protein